MVKEIKQSEFIRFQNEWGAAIVELGKLYTNKEDYKQAAIELVHKFYGYNEGTVLFKPTRAQQQQFRLNTRGALSYFIGGDSDYGEDTGFALQPWTKVRFENSGIIIDENHAVAMGNYFFTNTQGQESKVEYTMGVFRTKSGHLKMNLHHSSMPYQPV